VKLSTQFLFTAEARRRSARRTRSVSLLVPILLIGIFAGNAPLVQAAPADTAALVEQGVQAYAGGRYAEADAAWQKAWDAGARTPGLAYNLGDAAFRLHRPGPAVLWYQRALWLDPGHEDARHNLEYVRQLLIDKVPPPPPSFLGAAWEWLVERVGLNAAGGWLLALFAAACAAAVAFLRLREGPYRLRAAILLAVLAGGALLWGAIFTGLAWREDHKREAVILAPAADVRSGPSEGNPVLFTVHEGLTVEVAASARGWHQVVLPNGWNGWIPERSAGLVQEETR
jgi:tetratricopeptide (TPR) repeat protein